MTKLGRFMLRQVDPVLGLKDGFLEFQREILQARDEDKSTKLNDIKVSDLNMHHFTGLTASLLATASASTLVHPHLDDVHWIVQGLWSVVLVMAIITAFACCMYYSRLSEIKTSEGVLVFYTGLKSPAKAQAWAHQAKHKDPNLVGPGDFGYQLLKVWMNMPCLLLGLALSFFLAGLVLFWLLAWLGPSRGEETEGREASRNIFLLSLAGIAIPTVLMSCSVYLIGENNAVMGLVDREPAD